MTHHADIRRTLLFLIKDDQILLAMKKRGFGLGKLNGVGGKLETGETIVQGMVRECQEEIGVTPTAWDKVAELDFVQESDTPDAWHMYVHVYIGTAWTGEPTESNEMRPEWFNISDIPYQKMWEDDEYWLPSVLKGNTLTGKFTFDEDEKMTSHQVQTVMEFSNE